MLKVNLTKWQTACLATLSIPPRRAPAPRPADRPLRIGILGGGVAGLYTAIMIDSLGDPTITHDILEGNPDRNGGRLWTYRFSQSANDYYVRWHIYFQYYGH